VKKVYLKLGVIGSAIAGLIAGTSVFAEANYIDVNATSVASVIDYVTKLFSDVSVFIWLAIGLPLGFYVIKKIISIVGSRAK